MGETESDDYLPELPSEATISLIFGIINLVIGTVWTYYILNVPEDRLRYPLRTTAFASGLVVAMFIYFASTNIASGVTKYIWKH